MKSGWWKPAALALAAALLWDPATAPAQTPGSGEAARGWRPYIFAYVLRRAGDETLDPFGTAGRREVIQFLAEGSPERGRFLRARLDRLGAPDAKREGWYEITGDRITLYYADADGATGEVETGRYLYGSICLVDGEDRKQLTYELLLADHPEAPRPPPSPARAGEACGVAARQTS